jgi:A/G-specific adenine glycosylase
MAPPQKGVVGRAVPAKRRIQSFRARLLTWFSAHGRSFYWRTPGLSSYELVIAELLLQRTRAEVVATRLPSFLDAMPSWKAIRESADGQLEVLLRPLGLWRRRAASMRRLAAQLIECEEFPSTSESLYSLSGVGQYIANAICIFVLARPAPLLDVNMARVLERHFGARTKADIRYDPWLQALSHSVVNCEDCKSLNWAILDLAAKVCLPRRPRCTQCPVRRSCLYGRRVTR